MFADHSPADSRVPVYKPDLSGREREYVLDCIDSSWISSRGDYISRFESSFCQATGLMHAATVANGTVALHLALSALGIGPGDEVIVPTLTYVASVNTITMTGATPVFAECSATDWLIDPLDVESKITGRTRAILPVHLYGAVCDMTFLRQLADMHDLVIIEDCAEALGSTRDGKHVGAAADAATFSFFGNKTVTTGEGGMVVCRTSSLDDRVRLLKNQAQSRERRYWHEELGFNYRMTNICAAIGLAQVERLPQILARKCEIARSYRELLDGLPLQFQNPAEGVESSHWLVSLLLPKGADRDRVMKGMEEEGVETRPVFYCVHEMPMYSRQQRFSISSDISARGLSLPSYPTLTDGEIHHVATVFRRVLAKFL